MNTIGKPERETQDRIIKLFRDELRYRYLGDWSDRPGNSNIEEALLAAYLMKDGYTMEQISRAIYLLRTEAENPNRSLYDNNKAVYGMLRYGVPVKIEAGKVTETVKVINWQHPEYERFRHRRGSHAARQPRAPAGSRALRQRHRRRGDRAEEKQRLHERGHPAVALQSAEGFQRVVFHHRPDRLCRQRFRGAAIRHHRHAGKDVPPLEGETRQTTHASSSTSIS